MALVILIVFILFYIIIVKFNLNCNGELKKLPILQIDNVRPEDV